jgi:hypothetical protein
MRTENVNQTDLQRYTGKFEATWQDVLEGCTALLEELR